jgi:hypothetical protein
LPICLSCSWTTIAAFFRKSYCVHPVIVVLNPSAYPASAISALAASISCAGNIPSAVAPSSHPGKNVTVGVAEAEQRRLDDRLPIDRNVDTPGAPWIVETVPYGD